MDRRSAACAVEFRRPKIEGEEWTQEDIVLVKACLREVNVEPHAEVANRALWWVAARFG